MTSLWQVIPPWGNRPPVFYRPPTPEEVRFLREGRGGKVYNPQWVLGIPRCCPWGYPQVLLCRPLNPKGPFPTTFWLVCPFLSRRCGQLESEGGVRRLETRMARDPERMRRHHLDHAALRGSLLTPEENRWLRRNRPEWWRSLWSRGLGGIDFLHGDGGAKCLHLHTASWLGWGTHPFSSWLAAQFPRTHCDSPLCSGE